MKATSIPELQEIVKSHTRLRMSGGGSKTALSGADGVGTVVETSGLAGMLQYQPEEFTFTALAGTRLADIDAELQQHGQFLPFDPPLVEAGATLGGTVAAGLSGPCRMRYGGLRDFILGVRFVDGQGNLVRSGGKVVKNAAGFDLSKLMVGSLGQFGALVELSFKVFPRPQAYTTLRSRYSTLEDALQALARAANSPLELFALDLEPVEDGYALYARIGSSSAAVQAPAAHAKRIARLQELLRGEGEVLAAQEEAALWRSRREFTWLGAGKTLLKVPITPASLPPLESLFLKQDPSGAAQRIYSAAGNVAWVGWQGDTAPLEAGLEQLGLWGLALLGAAGKRIWCGMRRGQAFNQRVRQALDPQGKFARPAGGG